jgi:hypothetical protein
MGTTHYGLPRTEYGGRCRPTHRWGIHRQREDLRTGKLYLSRNKSRGALAAVHLALELGGQPAVVVGVKVGQKVPGKVHDQCGSGSGVGRLVR